MVASRKHSKYGLLCESILGSRQSTRQAFSRIPRDTLPGAFLLAPVLAGLVGKPPHIVLCDIAVVAPTIPEGEPTLCMCMNDATYNVVISDVLAGRLAPPKRAGELLDSDRPVKLPRPHWYEQTTDFLMSVPVPEDSTIADASGSSSGPLVLVQHPNKPFPRYSPSSGALDITQLRKQYTKPQWGELMQTRWDLVEGKVLGSEGSEDQ